MKAKSILSLSLSLALLSAGAAVAQNRIDLGDIWPAIPPWVSADPGATTLYPYWNDTNNRMEWLSASGYLSAVGGTTVGQNMFKATNPGAVRYIRINADNTVTFRTAVEILGDIGGGTSNFDGAYGSLSGKPVLPVFLSADPGATNIFPYWNDTNNQIEYLSAANYRAQIGGSTVGQNIFTAANPGAVRYVRINADNTVTFRTAVEMLGDLGGGSGGGDATLAGAQTFTGQKTFNLVPNIPPADLSTVTSSNTSTPAVNVTYYGTVAANRAITLPTAADGDSVVLNRIVFSGVYTLTFSTGVKRSGEANSTFTVMPVYAGVHTFVLKKSNSDWILSDSVGILHNDTASTDPTTGSDATLGYTKRSLWTNTSTGAVFVCTDNTASAAVWKKLGSGDFSSNTTSSVDGEMVLFSGTGGKTGKRATGSGLVKLASGVQGTATAGTDYGVPILRQTFSNAAATVTAPNNVIEQTGTLSASRTLTLAAANGYVAGDRVLIADVSGTVTTTNTIVVARAGSDTINGASTSVTLDTAYGVLVLETDGTSKWTIISAFGRAQGEVTLTDGATVTQTMIPGLRTQNAKVTLGGNRTLAFAGLVAGMEGNLRVFQDGTGSRTLALPANSRVNGSATTVTLLTAAAAENILSWYSPDGTNIRWTIGTY